MFPVPCSLSIAGRNQIRGKDSTNEIYSCSLRFISIFVDNLAPFLFVISRKKNFPCIDIGFHCRIRYFELFLLVRFIHQVAYYDYSLNKSGNNGFNNQNVF